jgi:multimeric flavodoxin WrbA
MKIAVINASPKGQDSVTLQSALFLSRRRPAHSFEVIDAGARIHALESDEAAFSSALETIAKADAVLWCFPVYYLLVPAQLKRFIELVFERGRAGTFSGKRALSLSTSIHFFDHTAHEYLREVSEDLGMDFFGGYSADMADLLKGAERRRLLSFWDDFEWAGRPPEGDRAREKVLVLDFGEGKDARLKEMISEFVRACPAYCEVVDASSLSIRGGCLGCIRCGYDNACVYKDGFQEFFTGKIGPADAVVFASPVKDRFLSSSFKTFIDRSFFRGHVPVLEGKALAFLLSGSLEGRDAAKQFLAGYSENSGARLAGIVSGEGRGIEALALRTARFAGAKTALPPTFLRAAAAKLFRDFVYRMPFVFAADHRFYRERGWFDFPNERLRERLGAWVLRALAAIPPIRRRMFSDMKRHMAEGHKEVVEKSRPS